MALYGYTINDAEVGDAGEGRWTSTPEGIAVYKPFETLDEVLGDLGADDAVLDVPWWMAESDDAVEIGTCWCGAYGRLGAVHNRKPSASEPVEECGQYL